MHTYFIEGQSYIDRKPVVEQLRKNSPKIGYGC